MVNGVVSSDAMNVDDVRVEIDWGDGRRPTLANLVPTSPPHPKQRQFSASHRYWDNSGTNSAIPNTYQIRAKAVDNDGSTGRRP